MDPRERLRLFLEQRRELGETEFVLDSLGVEEVMRVLGAGGRGDRRPSGALGGGASASGSGPANWREALSALGAGPEADREGPSGESRPPSTVAPRSPHSVREGRPAPGAPPRVHDTRVPPDMRNRPIPDPTVLTPASPPPRGGPTEAPSRAAPPLEVAPLVPLDAIPTGLVVGSAAHELFDDAPSPWESLDDIARAVAACTRCSLYKSAKHPVPGVGNPDADLVCVGEAPGASEDEQGVPFVGQAGQLLTKILGAIGLAREDVFICNVLKHRPPGNRNPEPDEVQACSPYLVRQIALLRPKVILALGTFAAQTLLQTRDGIGKLRGKIHRYHGVPLVVTYHPAALLRNPSWKRPTWEDVQLARRLLDRAAGA